MKLKNKKKNRSRSRREKENTWVQLASDVAEKMFILDKYLSPQAAVS